MGTELHVRRGRHEIPQGMYCESMNLITVNVVFVCQCGWNDASVGDIHDMLSISKVKICICIMRI